MSATRLWYPRYVRDFKAKTGHLTLAEKGAYSALMDEYWERQEPLPSDENTLCRLIGAFPDEWAQVRENVLAFFKEQDGKLYHKRIDEEIKKASDKYEQKARRMAEARAKRWPDKDQNTDQSSDQCTDQITDPETHQKSEGQTESEAESHILTDTKDQFLGASAPPKKSTPRATRLPSDWRPPPEFLDYAHSQNLSPHEASNEADKFRDYWVAKSGKDATKRDWLATWRNWIRNYVERRGAFRGGNTAGKVDDLRDLLNSAKEFDRRERESLRGDSEGPPRRAIGAS